MCSTYTLPYKSNMRLTILFIYVAYVHLCDSYTFVSMYTYFLAILTNTPYSTLLYEVASYK